MKAYHINKKAWLTVSSINFNTEDGSITSLVAIGSDDQVLVASDDELEKLAINDTIKLNTHLLA